MQAVLNRFAESIPSKPYCTNAFSDGTRILPRVDALKHKYIQAQIRKRQIGWLIFDIDRATASLAAESANLPPPTLTIVNPWNAHAHLVYQLAAPVTTTDKGRAGAIRYLESVERAYKHELRSDYAYSGLLTKNPLHSAWRASANDVRYELSELAEYVDLKKYKEHRTRQFAVGRNFETFETVRKKAYRIVRKYDSYSDFSREVLDLCYEVNKSFKNGLAEREIGTIAESICTWVWRRRDDLLISKNAIHAIEYAAASICSQLPVLQVCKFAQSEVARVSGLSTDTVQRFMQLRATLCDQLPHIR